MNRFTVEETNLISIYIADTRRELIGEMSGALPYILTRPRDERG